MVRPVLGELDLQQVQRIVVDDAEVFTAHAPTSIDAEFLQRLAHRSATIRLHGVLSGADARTGLASLRDRFRDAEPVGFAADVATATTIDQVLLEELAIREIAGHPNRFEYAFTLRQYSPPPAPRTETPPAPPAAPEPPAVPDPDQATLVVQVDAPSRPDLDHATVTIEAATVDAAQRRALSARQGNRWTEGALPTATWTITATAPGSAPGTMLSGTTMASTQGGQTAQATVTLNSGPTVALAEIVSFRFDRAFVEPCERRVLKQAAERAAGPDQHLLILGHTDKTGADAYNLALSQRRVDAVLAYLTAGNDPDASRQTWMTLRASDSWGLREAQQMLQDLGRYPGVIDGQDGPMTQEAVQSTRCQAGLAPGTLDDDAWSALIADYLRQDALTLDESILVTDSTGTRVRGFACGESHPLPLPKPTVATAHRPYRRVELIFTPIGTLPAAATPADAVTWDLAAAGPTVIPVVSTEPAQIAVQGSIQRLTRSADGILTQAPAPNTSFVLITSDGEFKRGEQGTGEPLAARTDARGEFSFTGLRAGWYSLEVRLPNAAPVLARLKDDLDDAARGPTVCAHLATGGDRLDVVLLPDVPRRQIRLPLVAHLMTMLNTTTHEPRTASVFGVPPATLPQRTVRTEADVRAALAVANRIWAPSRVAFDLVHVATEVTAHPDKPDGAVDNDEAGRLILGAGYPDVVNLFLIAVVEAGEAGVYETVQIVDQATNVVESQADGIAIGDTPLVAIFAGSPPVAIALSEAGRAVVLAHELGHYLSLDHAEGSRARPHQLMQPHVADDHQELLEPAETTKARDSDNAVDCRPVHLEITGAQPVGGTASVPSGLVVTTPDAAGVVTLRARISDAQLAAGAITWRGGAPGADPLERTVARVRSRNERVEATYTPTAAGAHPVTTFARVLITSFTLQVTGATRVGGPTGTTFIARVDPTATISVDAVLDRQPEAVTADLVTWSGGTPVTDLLRRTVSRSAARREPVSATLAGLTHDVTVIVFDLALVSNLAPFTTTITDVLVEGLPNEDLGKVRLAAVGPDQTASLFRARATLPGIQAGTVPATLTSTAADGSTIETVHVDLTRQAAGSDVFISVPLLVFPRAIPRTDLTFATPKDLDLIRAVSGGRVTFRVDGLFATESVSALVHARVARLDIQVFTGSGVTVAEVQSDHLPAAQRAWAQAGIEVLLRRPVQEVAPPDRKLLDLDHTDDTGKQLTAEENQLVGLTTPPPAGTVTTDLNVYYVSTIGPTGGAQGGGTVHGVAYPDFPVIAVADAATETALGHEIGHKFHQSHDDANNTDWPKRVIMSPRDTGNQRDVPPVMVSNILRRENRQELLRLKGTPRANPLMRHLVREP